MIHLAMWIVSFVVVVYTGVIVLVYSAMLLNFLFSKKDK